jgi:hypothetical protein
MLNQTVSHRCVPLIEWGLADPYLSPCFPRVLEKMFSLLSLEGSDLVPKTWLLLLQGAVSLS